MTIPLNHYLHTLFFLQQFFENQRVTITGKRENKAPKWQYLEHMGPVLPKEYQPLLAGVYLIYEKKTIVLSGAAEKAVSYYTSLSTSKNSYHLEDDVFKKKRISPIGVG